MVILKGVGYKICQYRILILKYINLILSQKWTQNEKNQMYKYIDYFDFITFI